MDPCTRCGHALGVGRYCVNCGHPRDASTDDWRSSTAERPAVPDDRPDRPDPAPPTQISEPTQSPWGPTAPPPIYQTPPQARYPMYADEPVAPVTSAAPAPTPGWDTPPPGGSSHRDRRRSSLLPWVLGAVALVLVAGLGVFLLLDGGDDGADRADRADDTGPTPGAGTTDPGGPSTSPSTPSTGPTTSDPASPTTDPFAGDPEDVASVATAVAPSTAPAGVDVDGNAVRYDAFNMLDGQDDTAWRTPGDASGSTIGFTLAKPTRLESVGLLNGYAKVDPGYDGYTANRRVLAVEWVFDDGTVVPQTLDRSREVQVVDVDVVTSTVQLRLLSVSRPAAGPRGRDYTAISTVALVGVPRR